MEITISRASAPHPLGMVTEIYMVIISKRIVVIIVNI